VLPSTGARLARWAIAGEAVSAVRDIIKAWRIALLRGKPMSRFIPVDTQKIQYRINESG
jgi:hypothetical protein